MRVIYIIHSLPVGGAETLVVNYILKLKQAGIDICLVELYVRLDDTCARS